MGTRNLSNKDILELDKDYDNRKEWDGVERRKGPSCCNPEMDRRLNKWTPKKEKPKT